MVLSSQSDPHLDPGHLYGRLQRLLTSASQPLSLSSRRLLDFHPCMSNTNTLLTNTYICHGNNNSRAKMKLKRPSIYKAAPSNRSRLLCAGHAHFLDYKKWACGRAVRVAAFHCVRGRSHAPCCLAAPSSHPHQSPQLAGELSQLPSDTRPPLLPALPPPLSHAYLASSPPPIPSSPTPPLSACNSHIIVPPLSPRLSCLRVHVRRIPITSTFPPSLASALGLSLRGS